MSTLYPPLAPFLDALSTAFAHQFENEIMIWLKAQKRKYLLLYRFASGESSYH
jgi:hypothetical protein